VNRQIWVRDFKYLGKICLLTIATNIENVLVNARMKNENLRLSVKCMCDAGT